MPGLQRKADMTEWQKFQWDACSWDLRNVGKPGHLTQDQFDRAYGK